MLHNLTILSLLFYKIMFSYLNKLLISVDRKTLSKQKINYKMNFCLQFFLNLVPKRSYLQYLYVKQV